MAGGRTPTVGALGDAGAVVEMCEIHSQVEFGAFAFPYLPPFKPQVFAFFAEKSMSSFIFT
jgi:hypothetical protein